MQSISTPSSSVYLKEKKVVSYFKSFLKSGKKEVLKSSAEVEPIKKADPNKDQLFTEIKSLLDDL